MPGILPLAGLVPKSRSQIRTEMLDALARELGTPLDHSATSNLSRLLDVIAGPIADGWVMASALWQTFEPAAASGALLDSLVSISGISRLPATHSHARMLLCGKLGTQLAPGRVVSSSSGARFTTDEPVMLARSLWRARIKVLSLSAGAQYRVTVEGVIHEATATSGATADSLSSALAADIAAVHPTLVVSPGARAAFELMSTIPEAPVAVSLAVVPRTSWQIRLESLLKNMTYNLGFRWSSGAVFLAVSVATDDVPMPVNLVANLVVQINLLASGALVAIELGDGLSFSVTAQQPGVAFSVSGNSSLHGASSLPHFSMRETTPAAATLLAMELDPLAGELVWMRAEQTGPTPAAAHTLTRIETPISGWERALNVSDAELGRKREEDRELVARRARSLLLPGVATREAIEARLMQEVPGVRAVRVVENDLDVTDSEGRPPHSFEVVLDAPADSETDAIVAGILWRLKPAGICTAPGPVAVAVTDSMGFEHVVTFSRPQWVRVVLDIELSLLSEEDFPPDGAEQVVQAVLAATQRLTIGEDVVLSRLLGPIYQVPGIGSVRISAQAPALPGPPRASAQWDHSGAGTNLAIGPRERSLVEQADIHVRVIP